MCCKTHRGQKKEYVWKKILKLLKPKVGMDPEVVTDADMSWQKSWVKPLSRWALPTNSTQSPLWPWTMDTYQGTAHRRGGRQVTSTLKLVLSAKGRRPRQKNPGPPGWWLCQPAIWPCKNQIAMKCTPKNKPGRFWRWHTLRPKAMKSVLQLGTWNVQTIFQAGEMQEITTELHITYI